MDIKSLLTAFSVVFLAEIGDKTSLAVITMSASSKSPLSVFAGASAALIAVTGIGALIGKSAGAMIPEQLLHRIAGGAFIAIGAWLIWKP
jgi:putative Ca2+/H+ antiporter (TMEM165/GDT1 family)